MGTCLNVFLKKGKSSMKIDSTSELKVKDKILFVGELSLKIE